MITKNMLYILVLCLIRDIICFKSEKGDNIKLSRAGFLYKQKRCTCSPKLQEIHS